MQIKVAFEYSTDSLDNNFLQFAYFNRLQTGNFVLHTREYLICNLKNAKKSNCKIKYQESNLNFQRTHNNFNDLWAHGDSLITRFQ